LTSASNELTRESLKYNFVASTSSLGKSLLQAAIASLLLEQVQPTLLLLCSAGADTDALVKGV